MGRNANNPIRLFLITEGIGIVFDNVQSLLEGFRRLWFLKRLHNFPSWVLH